jgi:lipopolysaccharide export system permease protein
MWMPNAIVAIAGLLLLARADVVAESKGRSLHPGNLRRRDRESIRPKRFAYPRYVARRFLMLAVLCLVGLAIASLILDVTDNLKWFTKYAATLPEIGRFYAARAPVLAARTIPTALLLACALTISLLGADGELIGMRACGVPTLRVLMPILALCAIAVPADYLVTNEFVPRANSRAAYVNRMEIKNGSTQDAGEGRGDWLRFDGKLLEAHLLDLIRGRTSALVLYELDETGLPLRRLDAESAQTVGGGRWALEASRSVELDGGRLSRAPAAERIVALPGRPSSEIETGEMTPTQIRALISALERNGTDSVGYRTDLHGRLAAPFTCVLLPLIALILSSTGPPFPRPVHGLMLSLALVLSQMVVAGVAASLGQRGVVPPIVAGWSPQILFGVVVSGVALRLRARALGRI